MLLPEVARLLASAAGWSFLTNRELTARVTGRRVTLAQELSRQVDPDVFRQFAAAPYPRTILAANLGYLTDLPDHRGTGFAQRITAAEALISSDRVVPILLTPRAESHTLEWWEERQSRLTGDRHEIANFNRSISQRRMFEAWEDFVSSQPGAIVARVQPSIPWGGPPVRRPAGGPIPQWFRHPLIGDIAVRVAYELAAHLRRPYQPLYEGPEPMGSLSRLGLLETSILGQNEIRLRQCTHGDSWEPDDLTVATSRGEAANLAYTVEPPKGSTSPTGRVLRFGTSS